MRKEHVVICPDCQVRMKLKDSRFGHFYGCINFPKCRVTHSCHKDGSPMGIPANKETRAERQFTHNLFDKLWRDRHMTRDQAYLWMQKVMGLSAAEAHIGRFTIEQCNKLMNHVEDFLGM